MQNYTSQLLMLVAMVVLSSLPLSILCQDVELVGNIVDSENNPLEFVNVMVFDSDSNFVKGVVTDIHGAFTLNSPQASTHYLMLRSLGLKEILIPISVQGTLVGLGTITMKPTDLMLEEVVVVADKSIIERHSDMIIVNVSKSILSNGTNGLELLERSPGLFVEDNGISLRGQTGVNIQINGRQQRLTGSELNSYLQSIPSSQIERIEIINNPSAAFDAEGSAGVVNIVLKKDGGIGTSLSANASFGQGVYHRTSEGLSLSSRNAKTSIYVGINHDYDQRYNQLLTTRRFAGAGEQSSTFYQNSRSKTPTHSYLSTFGLDYKTGKSSRVGVDITSNFSHSNQDANGNSTILDSDNTEYIGSFVTATESNDKRQNLSVNSYYTTDLKDDKGDFILNFDYASYSMNAKQDFNTNIYTAENQTNENLTGDIDGLLDLFVVKADVNLTPRNNSYLSLGLKSSKVVNDSNLEYFDVSGDDTSVNDLYSNQFEYAEGINAAYINWKQIVNSWTYQIGLRTEYTDIEGVQITNQSTFNRNYIQLFPSVFLEYKPSEKSTLGFNASRRINRPNYNQLNPFRSFVDITTSRVGNPNLVPEIANNLEIVYSHAFWLVLSLNYSNTLDRIIPVLIQDDINQSTSVQLINIDEFNYFGLHTSLSCTPLKSLKSRMEIEMFYNEFFGTVNSYNLSEKGLAFRVRTYHTYKFGRGWSSELNGFFQPLYNFGITSFEPRWKLDIGIQKSFINDKCKLKLAVTDLFWRYYPRGYTNFGNINEDFRSIRDTRVATLSVSYNFGNSKVKVKKNEGGASEEKRRTG